MGYISAKETISAAAKAQLSVADYLEMIWEKQGDTRKIIQQMQKFGVFAKPKMKICEIGTGSGRYLEKVIQIAEADHYESYEPDSNWARWLAAEYNILSYKANGKSLCFTKTSSTDLLHAHGVFVYLKFITTLGYFEEIIRVTKKGAHVVFDILSEDCFDDYTIKKWCESSHTYPAFLSRAFVLNFFSNGGFELIGEFFNPYGVGKSHYLILKKQSKRL